MGILYAERKVLMGEVSDIIKRIIELRDACDYTVEEFADMLGIDVDTYRSYEENGETIPVSVVFEIAKKCGVDFAEIITGVSAKIKTYDIVKAGEGKGATRYVGYNLSDLAFRFSNKVMQPLLVKLEPGDGAPELVSHNGQEFNYVVEGKMDFMFDDKHFILEQGDSVYFDATHKHGQTCAEDKPATFLTIIAE